MKHIEHNRALTISALLVAITIILTQFLSIPTPMVRIGFNFVPMALAGMLLGPFWAVAVAGIADFLGAVLFPTVGAYFPGFTLTAILCGLAYGLCLYRRDGGVFTGRALMIRTGVAVLIVTLVLQLGLNTFWLSIMLDKGYLALLPPRIMKQVIMIPVQFFAIQMLATLCNQLQRRGAI